MTWLYHDSSKKEKKKKFLSGIIVRLGRHVVSLVFAWSSNCCFIVNVTGAIKILYRHSDLPLESSEKY